MPPVSEVAGFFWRHCSLETRSLCHCCYSYCRAFFIKGAAQVSIITRRIVLK